MDLSLTQFASSLDRMKESFLLAAAQGGNLQDCDSLIELGADINWKGDGGDTPLLAACRRGHSETVSLLLAHGADCNSRSNDSSTALHICVQRNDIATLNVILDSNISLNSKNKDGFTALDIADRNQNQIIRDRLNRTARTMNHNISNSNNSSVSSINRRRSSNSIDGVGTINSNLSNDDSFRQSLVTVCNSDRSLNRQNTIVTTLSATNVNLHSPQSLLNPPLLGTINRSNAVPLSSIIDTNHTTTTMNSTSINQNINQEVIRRQDLSDDTMIPPPTSINRILPSTLISPSSQFINNSSNILSNGTISTRLFRGMTSLNNGTTHASDVFHSNFSTLSHTTSQPTQLLQPLTSNNPRIQMTITDNMVNTASNYSLMGPLLMSEDLGNDNINSNYSSRNESNVMTSVDTVTSNENKNYHLENTTVINELRKNLDFEQKQSKTFKDKSIRLVEENNILTNELNKVRMDYNLKNKKHLEIIEKYEECMGVPLALEKLNLISCEDLEKKLKQTLEALETRKVSFE